MKIQVIGPRKKIIRSPLLINKVRRRLSSNIGPKINPIINGAVDIPVRLKIKPKKVFHMKYG